MLCDAMAVLLRAHQAQYRWISHAVGAQPTRCVPMDHVIPHELNHNEACAYRLLNSNFL